MTRQFFHSIILALSLITGLIPIYGQTIDRVVNSNAYYTTNLKGEWVLGETMVRDFKGIPKELNSGFLQGKLHIISTNVEGYADFTFEVFPNPFYSQITIQQDFPDPLLIDIRDLHGRSLFNHKLIQNKTVLNMAHFPAGMYVISFHTNTTARGSFLIIK